jgi:hypothetical protein
VANIGVHLLHRTVLRETIAKQIASVRGHLIDDAPRAFAQFLRLVTVAARARDKKLILD